MFCCYYKTHAQSDFTISRNNNVSYISVDSVANTQCSVIEYNNFLVLIELPLGEWKMVYEEPEKVEKFMSFLNENFNNKPVKYILASHWHLHSLSCINSFLEKGAQLIVTSDTWEESTKRNLIKNFNTPSILSNVIKVNSDTTLLSNTTFPIEVIYLDTTFKRKPTKDYLFFYFPKTNTLHTSCMCSIQDIDYSTVKMYCYSDRLLDIERVIKEKSLKVENIIRLNFNRIPALLTYNYVENIIKNGVNSYDMIKHYVNLNIELLNIKQDSILHQAIEQRLHSNLLNLAAYDCIKIKDYEKAIKLSQLLNLYYPGVLSYINTMGECYYKSGMLNEALYYDKLLNRLDKQTKYGYKLWSKNY